MDPTAKTSPRVFLGFTVGSMAHARNLEVNATVNLAGWVTCAIALSVKYPANLVHAQMTQRSVNATTTILANHVTGKSVCTCS